MNDVTCENEEDFEIEFLDDGFFEEAGFKRYSVKMPTELAMRVCFHEDAVRIAQRFPWLIKIQGMSSYNYFCETPRGNLVEFKLGDWLIKEKDGFLTPCSHDDFFISHEEKE